MTQVSCHKCRQALPHESDSWCLGCSAAEALSLELRNIWGSPGTRAIATDLICSCLRQVRALRRLGVGGAGVSLASPAASDTPVAPGSLRPPEPAIGPKRKVPEPIPAAAPEAEVKQELKEDSEESEEESTSGEDQQVGTAAKSKAEPLPRRRSGGHQAVDRAEHQQAPEGEARLKSRSRKRDKGERTVSEKKDRTERKRRRSGHHSSSWRGRSPGKTEGRSRREGSGRRKSHRGGAKHQRLYRAAEDPFKRFHQQRPEGYWDQEFPAHR